MIVETFDKKVDEFIKSLDITSGTKVARMLNLLEQFGPILGMPYSRSLGNKLFELRIRGQQEVRIFYTFYRGKAFLLHGFIKKTQKTPLKELEKAQTKLRALTPI